MVLLSVIYYLDEKKRSILLQRTQLRLQKEGVKNISRKLRNLWQFLEGLEFMKFLNNTQHLKFSVTL